MRRDSRHGPDDVRDEVKLPTTSPVETLAALERVLDGWGGFTAVGVASFEPVGVDPSAPDWSWIATTPTPGWAQTAIAIRLVERYRVPVGFHTDVIGAALGERAYGAATGLANYAYVIVGTG